jgi:hypothetical protein
MYLVSATPNNGRTDGRMDGRTDGRMDGRTDMVIPIYLLSFVCGGYKNNKYHTVVKSSKTK